jgi:hypothetical protein
MVALVDWIFVEIPFVVVVAVNTVAAAAVILVILFGLVFSLIVIVVVLGFRASYEVRVEVLIFFYA